VDLTSGAPVAPCIIGEVANLSGWTILASCPNKFLIWSTGISSISRCTEEDPGGNESEIELHVNFLCFSCCCFSFVFLLLISFGVSVYEGINLKEKRQARMRTNTKNTGT
jgi:hypothetical protein